MCICCYGMAMVGLWFLRNQNTVYFDYENQKVLLGFLISGACGSFGYKDVEATSNLRFEIGAYIMPTKGVKERL